MAKAGYERIEETEDPEKAFDRAMETYLKKAYSRNWINQRLKSIEVRKELTDEWHQQGMKEGLEIEKQTGKPIVLSKNAKELEQKNKNHVS